VVSDIYFTCSDVMVLAHFFIHIEFFYHLIFFYFSVLHVQLQYYIKNDVSKHCLQISDALCRLVHDDRRISSDVWSFTLRCYAQTTALRWGIPRGLRQSQQMGTLLVCV